MRSHQQLNYFTKDKWKIALGYSLLPSSLGFVGVWSMPIKTKDDKVLGTFGTYFREQGEPSVDETKGVALLASAAAVVVARNR